eukprot:scaffold160500_cov21-Tisochrysis_lutea.AAC.5
MSAEYRVATGRAQDCAVLQITKRQSTEGAASAERQVYAGNIVGEKWGGYELAARWVSGWVVMRGLGAEASLGAYSCEL